MLPGNSTASAQEVSASVSLTQLRAQTRDLLRSESLARDPVRQRDSLTALCDLYVILRKDPRFGQSEMLQQDASKVRRRLLTAAGDIKARLRRLKIPRPNDLRGRVDQAIRQAAAQYDADRLGTMANDSSANDDSPQLPQTPESDSLGGEAAGLAAAGIADNGWQLVELIQRIVAPDFWDQNGGPGSITYFAIRRVLVVRATSDVHEQIRDLLIALPR